MSLLRLSSPVTRKIRSSQSPGHGIHFCWMCWQNLDQGSLLQPSSASTRESENCWPGLWLPWVICCNSGNFQLCFCYAAHSFDQRPPSGSQCAGRRSWKSVPNMSHICYFLGPSPYHWKTMIHWNVVWTIFHYKPWGKGKKQYLYTHWRIL